MKKLITLIVLLLNIAAYGQGVNTLEIKKVDEQSSVNSETKLMVWDSTNFGKVKYKKLGDLSIDNALNYVTVTDSIYTLQEADILAYKPHIIETYRADGTTPADTVVVTYPKDITPPTNEMLAVTFTNISGSALKIIPDSTLVIDKRTKTQRQYILPKDYLGSASLFSISKDTIWANGADWVISDYTPPSGSFDSGLILNGTFDNATNIDLTGTSDWSIGSGVATLTVPTVLSSDSFGDNDIRFLLSEVPTAGVNYELTFDISSTDDQNRIAVETQGGTNYYLAYSFTTLANGTYTIPIQFTNDGGGIQQWVAISASTSNPDNITIDNVSLFITDIPDDAIGNASPLSYYTPESIVSTADTEGANVTAWTDEMGNHDLTSTAGQPTLHLDSVDSARQVRFDGVDDGMNASANTVFNFTPGTDSFSFVIVLGENVADDGGTHSFGKNSDGAGEQYTIGFRGGVRYEINIGGTNENYFTAPNGRDVIILNVNGTQQELFINGVSAGTELVGTQTSTQTFAIGYQDGTTDSFANIDFERIAIFNRVLTAQEITDINAEF
jgi:hypothetical protein